MFYKEILEQAGPRSAFLEDLQAQFFLALHKPGGTLVGSMYVLAFPKNLWICHCRRKLTRIRKILVELMKKLNYEKLKKCIHEIIYLMF